MNTTYYVLSIFFSTGLLNVYKTQTVDSNNISNLVCPGYLVILL